MVESLTTGENTDQLFELVNELSEKNDEHVEELAETLEQYKDGQDPEFTSIACCDSRVLQMDMWKNYMVGSEFTHGIIGNHANSVSYWNNMVPAGSVDYIPEHTDTGTGVVVIGHTGCGAVTATYETMKAVVEDDENSVEDPVDILEKEGKKGFSFREYTEETEGIDTDIALLMEAGLDQSYQDLENGLSSSEEINRLVEYNVDNQVEFLLENTDYKETEIFGAVYDMDGTYGEPGRLYLTNFNGEKDTDVLKEEFGEYANIVVERLDS